jgi:hypothetical protein
MFDYLFFCQAANGSSVRDFIICGINLFLFNALRYKKPVLKFYGRLSFCVQSVKKEENSVRTVKR